MSSKDKFGQFLQDIREYFGARPERDFRKIPTIYIGNPHKNQRVIYTQNDGGVEAIAIEKGFKWKGYVGNWEWGEHYFKFTSNTMDDSDFADIKDALAGWQYYEAQSR